VEKSVKKMQNKKTAGDDESGKVLRMFGQDDLKITTQLINKICTAGEWNEYCTEIITIALKNQQKATKCSDHYILSLIAHTARIVARIYRRRIERKLRMYLENISLD
jgi:hypothetical protein